MDKFKDDIQQKFNQREIHPTDEAWGKITGELATSRTSKTKVLWLWSGIAAGFIGLLVLLSPLYFRTNTTIPVVNSKENETKGNSIQLEKVLFVSQLKSNGIQILPLKFTKPKLAIEISRSNSNNTLLPNHLKAETLLAEVEQELEEERFSQKNLNEVDALLVQARANLSSKKDQRIFDKLSAESLLAEVDLENSDSFKDKIWKLIETNFKELKTSLGAR